MNRSLSPSPYRQLTDQLVSRVATANGETRYEVYNRIYERLRLHYGVNLIALRIGRSESLLGVAERLDLLDKVYSFASAELLYLQAASA
jgi:hypothetical protein